MKNFSVFLKGTEMYLVGRDNSANEELKNHINLWVQKNQNKGWSYNSTLFFGDGRVLFMEDFNINKYRPIMGEDYLGALITLSSESLETIESAVHKFLDSFENSLLVEIRETS
jgi:hypothetical protein